MPDGGGFTEYADAASAAAAAAAKSIDPARFGFGGDAGAQRMFARAVALLRGANLCPGLDAAGAGTLCDKVRTILSALPVPFNAVMLGKLLTCLGVERSAYEDKRRKVLGAYALCATADAPAPAVAAPAPVAVPAPAAPSARAGAPAEEEEGGEGSAEAGGGRGPGGIAASASATSSCCWA